MQQITSFRDVPVRPWASVVTAEESEHYELRYRPLAEVGSRANYLYARAAVGYELEWPLVRRLA
jgi:hypothetical protein